MTNKLKWKIKARSHKFKLVKYILVITGFLLIVNIASAQRFDGGILVGYNATQIEGDNAYRGYHKPGLAAGFYVQTDVAPAVFVAMEIKYSQKGERNKIKKDDPIKYIMRLGYIDIPIYAAFRTNDRGSIIGGISTGFLVHSGEFNNDGLFQIEDQHPFNTLDVQPFIGFQFDFLDNIKADLRFALSVLPIRDLSGNSNYNVHNGQFNNVITLALYYQIGK